MNKKNEYRYLYILTIEDFSSSRSSNGKKVNWLQLGFETEIAHVDIQASEITNAHTENMQERACKGRFCSVNTMKSLWNATGGQYKIYKYDTVY